MASPYFEYYAPSKDPSKYFGPREKDQRRKSAKRTFEVSHLWEIHHEITRRIFLGQKNSDIARALNVSEAMISYTRNSPIVQNKLAIMKGARDADTIDLSKRIREFAPIALNLIEDAVQGSMNGVSPTRRLVEANNILDRAGYAAQKTFRAEHYVAHYTGEEIEEIKQRAREAGKKSNIVIDAEIVPSK